MTVRLVTGVEYDVSSIAVNIAEWFTYYFKFPCIICHLLIKVNGFLLLNR